MGWVALKEVPHVPECNANRAKCDPTVLLALFPVHTPILEPSTLYLVPKGTVLRPFVKKAWVVFTTASWTALEEAPAATMSSWQN